MNKVRSDGANNNNRVGKDTHQFNGCCWEAKLNKLDSLEFEIAIDFRLGQQDRSVNVKGHDVAGCFALVLFRFESHYQPVVCVGHEFEAGESVGGTDVADPLGLVIVGTRV